MKRTNVWIIGIKKGEKTKVKSTENIFKKVIEKISSTFKEGDDYQDTRSIQSTK